MPRLERVIAEGPKNAPSRHRIHIYFQPETPFSDRHLSMAAHHKVCLSDALMLSLVSHETHCAKPFVKKFGGPGPSMLIGVILKRIELVKIDRRHDSQNYSRSSFFRRAAKGPYRWCSPSWRRHAGNTDRCSADWSRRTWPLTRRITTTISSRSLLMW